MTYFKNLIRCFKSQRDGSASIEFVMIAPILIFLYIGLYEVSIAYSVNGSINRSTEIAASFPTFEEELNEEILSNVMTAATAVIDYSAFNPENLAIDIYSIEQQGSTPDTRRLVGQASYAGSNASGIRSDLEATDFENILSTIDAGNGFIVAQVAYLYEPSITNKFIQALTLTDRKILNPRENLGQALNVTAMNGSTSVDRVKLNCTLNTGFSCAYDSQLP